MRVTVDDLGMDFSMVKGLLAAHRISAGPWFSVFNVFFLTTSARFLFILALSGLGFLSPLMVLGEWKAAWVFEGFLGTMSPPKD